MKKIIIVAIFFLATSSVFALPKGKPFIELDEKIVKLQGEIQSLKEQLLQDNSDPFPSIKNDIDLRYESLEDKHNAIDVKIEDMEDQDQVLADLIGDAVLATNENSTRVAEMLQQKDDLDLLILTAEDNIVLLLSAEEIDQQAIDRYQSEIDVLNHDLGIVHNAIAIISPAIPPLFAQKQGIAELIESLYKLKIGLSEQEAGKQEKLDRGCAEGELMKIFEDGSFTCTSVGIVENSHLIPMRITIHGPWVWIRRAGARVIKRRKIKTWCGEHILTDQNHPDQYHCHYQWKNIYKIYPRRGVARSFCPEGTLLVSKTALTISPAYVYSIYRSSPDGIRVGTGVIGLNRNIYKEGAIRAVSYCMGGVETP